MSTLFTESPFWLVIAGILLTGVLVVLYRELHNQRLLPWLALSVGLVVVPVLTDWIVETTRETLQRRVFEMAGAVRRNDVDGLLRFVDKDATDVINQINGEIPRYRFSVCSVTSEPRVDVEPGNPRRAKVQFRVLVSADDLAIQTQTLPGVRDVHMEFALNETGQWKLVAFAHYGIPEIQGILGR